MGGVSLLTNTWHRVINLDFLALIIPDVTGPGHVTILIIPWEVIFCLIRFPQPKENTPHAIFATQLSPRAVYFIQTGGSALSNTKSP